MIEVQSSVRYSILFGQNRVSSGSQLHLVVEAAYLARRISYSSNQNIYHRIISCSMISRSNRYRLKDPNLSQSRNSPTLRNHRLKVEGDSPGFL
jgi:hypothetical protein